MKSIIMAGGLGTRLWPLSRGKCPKQFMQLKGFPNSLFQMAVERSLKFCDLSDICVVTAKGFEHIVLRQIEGMHKDSGKVSVLLEPQPRSTLPAIYNAVKHFREASKNDIAMVLASDHLMLDDADLLRQIKLGAKLADDYIFAFGIAPSRPETAFGYISMGEPMAAGYRIAEFKEKPDAMAAKKYVSEGYCWNSGMFLFGTELFEHETKEHANDVYKAFLLSTADERFNACPNVSIDYGLMEKTNKKAVLPVSIPWSDLGGYSAFYETYATNADEQGNVSASGLKNDIFINAAGNFVYPVDNKIYAIIGVNDLVIIDQGDALLITDREHSQSVKKVMDELKARGDDRADFNVSELMNMELLNVT
jgi:mannose-1-phosphate guanylyltransferase/mannose-6-phosphate isomerase